MTKVVTIYIYVCVCVCMHARFQRSKVFCKTLELICLCQIKRVTYIAVGF